MRCQAPPLTADREGDADHGGAEPLDAEGGNTPSGRPRLRGEGRLRAAPPSGAVVLGTATTAESGRDRQLEVRRSPTRCRRRCSSVASGFDVGTLTVAAVVPLLNAVNHLVSARQVETGDDEHRALRQAHDRRAGRLARGARRAPRQVSSSAGSSGLFGNVEARALADRRRADARLRSASRVTCVGNMSWRAAWSPPDPIIPTSSPYSTAGAPRSRWSQL